MTNLATDGVTTSKSENALALFKSERPWPDRANLERVRAHYDRRAEHTLLD
jgi:hypothetical protein